MREGMNIKYLKIQKVGEGPCGVIYKAKDVQTNQIVALKKFKLNVRKQSVQEENEGIPSSALREISILRQLNHPNIIKLISQIILNKKLHLVMEYHEKDLNDYLKNENEEINLKYIMFKILSAVEFLHQKKIIHRDLQPSNILVNNNEPVLIDFGLSRNYSPKLTPGVSHLWYRAPELLQNNEDYDFAIDMWSLGCIFLEIICKQPIFMGTSEMNQLELIKYQIEENSWININPYFSKFNKIFIDLINNLLQFDPQKRIQSNQALKHPFFQDQNILFYNDNNLKQ